MKTQDRVSSVQSDTRHLCNNIIGDADSGQKISAKTQDPEPKTAGTDCKISIPPGPLHIKCSSSKSLRSWAICKT